MTDRLFEPEVTAGLSTAQFIELMSGPAYVFSDGCSTDPTSTRAFNSEAEREQAWRQHRDHLCRARDKEPWALRYYEGGQRAA